MLLIKLPYIDLIRFTVIDPMHNLYLGTAKRMIHYWTNEQQHDTSHPILTKADLKVIQEIINTNLPLSNISHIPHKIAAGFSSFMADQWCSWILLYSTFCLCNYLPENHRHC